MTRRCSLAAAVWLAALPCGAGAADLTFRERGTLAVEARAILRTHCGGCHGDSPARGDLSVTDYKSITAKAAPVPFVNLLDPQGRSQVIEFLDDGSMPPGGRDRPTAAEIATLKKWVAASAPSYPKAFDDRATLAALLADFARQPAADRPFLRYLSLAHLVGDDGPPPNLAALDLKLQKALFVASGKQASPDAVDDTATLFRIDLRKLGWDTRDLFQKTELGKPVGVYPMVPFDLVLLEYPHGFTLPPGDRQFVELDAFLKATKQLRPVPFVRGDWLADALRDDAGKPPGARPLADELRSLVQLGEAWAKRKNDDELMPCGPEARPFLGAKSVKPAVPAGTRPVAPLGAWYAGDVAPDREPFAVKFDAVLPMKGNKVTAVVETGEPFRLRLETDRPARFLILNVLASGEPSVMKVEGGTIADGKGARLLGPTKLPFVIGSLPSNKPTEVLHWVVIAAEGDADIPLPTVVRSRHDEAEDCRAKNHRPIWRAVFAGDTFDPNKAMRRVVPVTVKRPSD